ncbi:MAG TPA: hypothetical protein VNJ02_02095 [Vicinamibacterales bacterium]|nr:hypothetical protein [Vicinamibacterales bacterium]
MELAQNIDDALGPPGLQVAGLRVWVHEQPYAGSDEPYDADWLTVTAQCSESGASVRIRGAFLTSSAFERLAVGCEQLHAHLAGRAWLASEELNLHVVLETTDRLGHLTAVVAITPDHLTQEHRFEFQIDQTYLPEIAQQCRAILARYPNLLPLR